MKFCFSYSLSCLIHYHNDYVKLLLLLQCLLLSYLLNQSWWLLSRFFRILVDFYFPDSTLICYVINFLKMIITELVSYHNDDLSWFHAKYFKWLSCLQNIWMQLFNSRQIKIVRNVENEGHKRTYQEHKRILPRITNKLE